MTYSVVGAVYVLRIIKKAPTVWFLKTLYLRKLAAFSAQKILFLSVMEN